MSELHLAGTREIAAPNQRRLIILLKADGREVRPRLDFGLVGNMPVGFGNLAPSLYQIGLAITDARSRDRDASGLDYRVIQDSQPAMESAMWKKNLTSAGTHCTKSELVQMRAACPSSMRGRVHTAARSRGTEGKTRTRAADQLFNTDQFRIHAHVPARQRRVGR